MQWCYIVFFTIFELGSAVCGAAQSSNMLIVGRAIAGVGAAGISSGAYTVLSASVPLEKRPGKLSNMDERLEANTYEKQCWEYSWELLSWVQYAGLWLEVPSQQAILGGGVSDIARIH